MVTNCHQAQVGSATSVTPQFSSALGLAPNDSRSKGPCNRRVEVLVSEGLESEEDIKFL